MICPKNRKRKSRKWSGTPRNLRVTQRVRGTTRKFRSAPLAALVKLILGQSLCLQNFDAPYLGQQGFPHLEKFPDTA